MPIYKYETTLTALGEATVNIETLKDVFVASIAMSVEGEIDFKADFIRTIMGDVRGDSTMRIADSGRVHINQRILSEAILLTDISNEANRVQLLFETLPREQEQPRGGAGVRETTRRLR